MSNNHTDMPVNTVKTNEVLNRVANDYGLLQQARKAMEHQLSSRNNEVENVGRASLFIDADGTLSVQFLDRVCAAKPRVVIEPDGNLALEYTFLDVQSIVQTALWQFYLFDEGKQQYCATRGFEAGMRIHDHNNARLKGEILTAVCNAMVAAMFKPTTMPEPA